MAPASRIDDHIADRVSDIAARLYPDQSLELFFHPQCFLTSGHFAGDDATRRTAFLDIANDARFDALWFARGGYGACRLTENLLPELNEAARSKTYLGYSDVGSLMALLYGAGIGHVVHGPMPTDILRKDGEKAVERALAYLAEREPATLEPGLPADVPSVAFNLTTLSHLLGTLLQPDLTEHVLLLEDISEHMYRIDRSMFHVTSNPALRRLAGIRLGRCSEIPENDPEFGKTEDEVVRHWCTVSGIPYLGRADIGHDADNKVVPFGLPRDR